MTEGPMTPAKAAAMAETSAKVLQLLFDTAHAHPDLDWEDLAVSTALAMRGLAARECANNPALTPGHADAALMRAFFLAMTAPRELVRVVKQDASDGPDTVGVIPLRSH